MTHALIASSIYSLVFLWVLYFAERIRKRWSGFQEISRKAVHVFSGIIALTFPYYIHSHWVVLGLVGFFGLLMMITKKKHLLSSVHEVGRKSYGSLYYPIAIYLIYLLASHTPVLYFTSILVLTVSDAFAALVGKKYGTIKYEIEGNIKSLEGNICFFFLSFVCVLLPLLIMSNIGKLEAIFIALIISILLTGFEAISPTGSDNIIIPYGTYFILSKMTALPLPMILNDLYILIGTVGVTAMISLLNVSGLIGMMLLNYAAFTLGNIFWVIPLVITEIFLFFCLRKENQQFSLPVLFYLGFIPAMLLFVSNALKNESLFFIPYVVSIVSQIPMSHMWRQRKPYSLIASLLIICGSLWAFYGTLDLKLVLGALLCTLVVWVLNKVIHRGSVCQKNEYRIRLACALIGSTLAFLGVTYV
jgi:dolichol kinase